MFHHAVPNCLIFWNWNYATLLCNLLILGTPILSPYKPSIDDYIVVSCLVLSYCTVPLFFLSSESSTCIVILYLSLLDTLLGPEICLTPEFQVRGIQRTIGIPLDIT